MHILVECGCCDCLHPQGYTGDCRNDEMRFSDAEDYAERMGVSVYMVDVVERG